MMFTIGSIDYNGVIIGCLGQSFWLEYMLPMVLSSLTGDEGGSAAISQNGYISEVKRIGTDWIAC